MINKIYKSVLITGAADGIGLETLKRVLKEKIDVYALDKNITKLKKLQKKYKFTRNLNRLPKLRASLKIFVFCAEGAEKIFKAEAAGESGTLGTRPAG